MNKLKSKIVELAYKAKEGHIASSLSVLDVLCALYSVIDIKSIMLEKEDRPRVILSKGHASLALYTVLEYAGILPSEILDTYCQFNSILGGHPKRNTKYGIEASTGSLGHGAPIAVGLALGYKIKGYKNKIYCIVGDGECNEGSIWESILLAVNHNLNNLIIIVDYNHSNDRALKYHNLYDQFLTFGCDVYSTKGHDHSVLSDKFCRNNNTRPIVIIANTIKGNGIKRMENSNEWHHKIPNETEYKEIMEELCCQV